VGPEETEAEELYSERLKNSNLLLSRPIFGKYLFKFNEIRWELVRLHRAKRTEKQKAASERSLKPRDEAVQLRNV
jgi:hypothetical protein